MMEMGPDQKRPRISGSWSSSHRELPPPPQPAQNPPAPYQDTTPFTRPPPQHHHDGLRRDVEYHHPTSQSAPPHTYHPQAPPPMQYAGARDPIVKRDPSDEPLPQHQRPRSTGNGPDHTVHTPHPSDEHNRQYFPPRYENSQPPGGPTAVPYRTPSYPPPSPMATTQPYEHPMYGAPVHTPMREQVYPGQAYSPTVAAPKRKPTRAAQACDSCRTLKAKCDEQRPCSSCKEKNTPCVYRDPPPKQYVKYAPPFDTRHRNTEIYGPEKLSSFPFPVFLFSFLTETTANKC